MVNLFHSFFIISKRECLFKICLTELMSISCLFLKTTLIPVNFFLTHAVCIKQFYYMNISKYFVYFIAIRYALCTDWIVLAKYDSINQPIIYSINHQSINHFNLILLIYFNIFLNFFFSVFS